MADLNPTPASLGLASPGLGPWFQVASSDDSDIGDIGLPDADLSCPIALPDGAIWNAPANGLLSLFVANAMRPAALATLRQANGKPAFADNAFVLLFTLLPEVAVRLGTLAQAAPRADSTAVAAVNETTRPMINRLALELTPTSLNTIADLGNILPDTDAADLRKVFLALTTDAEKANFVGLEFDGSFDNADKPAKILRRPEKKDRRLLENRTGGPLSPKLWAFDIHGRPYDAGALAALWGFLATDGWDNLWASDDAARQRTKSVVDGRIVHLVNAHEGPLESAIRDRIAGQLTDLTPIAPSDVLFTAATAPTIALTAAPAPDTDNVPIPRIAPLPAGPYAAPGTATPFAGWNDAAALSRDFLRVAITDIEAMTVGLPRTVDTPQADPRRRISPARNSATQVFLPTIDAVANEVMARFAEPNATVQFIAPELDRLWGPQVTATMSGGDPFSEEWGDPAFTAHVLKGSGMMTASIAEDQSVILYFNESLPPDAWVRAWPHGRDTDTGRRFRMTGGAAKVDGSGNALVMLPLPNGRNGDGTDSERFSFDLMLVTDAGSRLYTDRRANRPAVDSSVVPWDIATPLAEDQALYCPQTGSTIEPSINTIPPGAGLFVLTGTIDDHDYRALDPASLRPEDMTTSLASRADAADRIITRDPSFVQTTPGDLPENSVAGGPERVHGSSFHTTATGQEMYDLSAYDTTGNQGVIGALTARAAWHEAPPPALAHAGVSAAPEIHGAGIAVAGPAADALRLLMRERAPSDIGEFISTMGVPIVLAPSVTDPGPWTTLLETAAKGTHGHMLMSLFPANLELGKTWDSANPADPGIKQQIDDVLSNLPGGLTTDSLIDGANFDDNTAAAAFDRVLDKHRKGKQSFARAAMAAIDRAEDLVWLQSPALDNESFAHAEGNIHLLDTLTDRLNKNPALYCLIIIPEKHLPNRNIKLDKVRKAAIGAALQALDAAAKDRVAWVCPIAGPGRAYHMGATTLIVDDAVMLTGAAHTWRRGLVFDSAISAAVFDDLLDAGRPRTVAAARRLLAGNLLSINPAFVPLTAPDLIAAAKALNAGGGFNRTNPAAYSLADDTTSAAEKEIWNPALSAETDWTSTLAGIGGDLQTEFENGTR
jgi:hypothetical protein